jgi:hypothetical protein
MVGRGVGVGLRGEEPVEAARDRAEDFLLVRCTTFRK